MFLSDVSRDDQAFCLESGLRLQVFSYFWQIIAILLKVAFYILLYLYVLNTMGCFFSHERNLPEKGLKLTTLAVGRKMKYASLGLGLDRVSHGGMAWILVNTERKLDHGSQTWLANLSLGKDRAKEARNGNMDIKSRKQDGQDSTARQRIAGAGMVNFRDESMVGHFE